MIKTGDFSILEDRALDYESRGREFESFRARHFQLLVPTAVNKWLKPRLPEGCVVHSFRHSLRDRLRAVQCPLDMIDQIGGWSIAGVG